MKHNKGITMMEKTIISIVVLTWALLIASAGAEVITPVDIVANSQYDSGTIPGNLINPSHLNDSNQHIPRAYNKNWLASDALDPASNWIFVDLGGLYSLDEIRIWNYHENGGGAEVSGRSTKASSIWVGGANAELPIAGQNTNVFNSDNGWSSIWAGDLKQGPSSVYASTGIDPTNVFDVSGQTKIRYVGIDITSRWGADGFTSKAPGLSYIQVVGKGFVANNPVPRVGEKGADVAAALSWTKPGLSTPSTYEVYISTDEQKVVSGDASVKVSASDSDGNSKNTQLVPDAELLASTQYFWRVDSIADGKTSKGNIWSFRTSINLDGLGFDEVVFLKRKPYSSDHNYTMVYNGTSADRFVAENGIYAFNLKTKTTREIISSANMPEGKGVFSKFSLSFDAKKLVFDYRKDILSSFRIWEVNIDGTGLRQITFAPEDEAEKIARYGVEFMDHSYLPNSGASMNTDDIHPCYLPDGGIVFSSSRCEIGVLCFGQPIVPTLVLHRMDADGGNIEQLTQSPVSEFSPTVLNDGRILYHRWEYIDRGARVSKTFWAMNPDGTKSEELFGLANAQEATGAYTYPKPVPGDKPMIVCSVGPHCPQGNSVGPIKLIDLSKDNRTAEPLTNITPDVEIHSSQGGWVFDATNSKTHSQTGVGGPLYGHPFPVNAKQFLVSHKDNDSDHYQTAGAYSIYIIDTEGNKSFVYADEDKSLSCWHPTPLKATKTPGVIAPSISPELKKLNLAECIVTNVYEGMEGVEPGSVKYIRINEAIPQYWDAKRKWGPKYESATWPGALWPRVQWGIVPVEKDGSAYFTVPADRNIFFQALDENYMEVQRERTYVNYRPGEVRTCIGCHERSNEPPSLAKNRNPLALQRDPSVPGPQPGETNAQQVIDYPTDIQPILDAKCISCHGNKEPDAGLILTGDITGRHNVSFEQLMHKRLAGPLLSEFIAPNGSDHANTHGAYLPPMSLGSYESKLVSTIRTVDSKDPHYDLLSQAELLKVIRWTDTNYQFFGSYYGRHHGAHAEHPEFRRKATFEEATSSIAPEWHN